LNAAAHRLQNLIHDRRAVLTGSHPSTPAER